MLIVYVAPWISDVTIAALRACVRIPGYKTALLTGDNLSELEKRTRAKLIYCKRISFGKTPETLLPALNDISRRIGRINTLLGDAEQIQQSLALMRERLEIPGMTVSEVRNFRDKFHMKSQLVKADIPCARFCLGTNKGTVRQFARDVGFPLVVKPRAGARAECTLLATNQQDLGRAVEQVREDIGQEALVEEYIEGQEYSCESLARDGNTIWQSITQYLPSPLQANIDRSCHFAVILPKVLKPYYYRHAKAIARSAIRVLGMRTGLTHMEWFLKHDGSVIVSEIAARPPGAKISELVYQSYGLDLIRSWVDLLVTGSTPVSCSKRYASGAIFIKPKGDGVIVRVGRINNLPADTKKLVVQKELPWIGQVASHDYEGNGYVIVRDRQTRSVKRALYDISQRLTITAQCS